MQGQGRPRSPNWKICEGWLPSGGHRGTAEASRGFCSVQERTPPQWALLQWQSQPPQRLTTRSSTSVAGTSVRHAGQSVVIFQAFPLLMAHPKDLVPLFLRDKLQASPELRSGSASPRSPGIPGPGSLGSLLLSYVRKLVVHSALLGQAHL